MNSFFRFKYRGLYAGEYPVDLQADAAELEMPRFFGDVTAKGIVKIAEQLHFKLALQGTGNFICDRCGREFIGTVNGELDVNFVPPGLDNEVVDDVFVHVYDPVKSAEVDLTVDIRDSLLLAIPMKLICGPDCPGFKQLEFEPEETENISRLRKLMEKMKGEE